MGPVIVSATPVKGSVGIASRGKEFVGRTASIVDAEEASLAVSAEEAGKPLEEFASGGAGGADTLSDAV
jgi:hypothetical protein